MADPDWGAAGALAALPPEVLACILEFLDLLALAAVSQTCAALRAAAYDPWHIRTRHIRLAFASHCPIRWGAPHVVPSIRSLFVSNVSGQGGFENLMWLLESATDLRALSFSARSGSFSPTLFAALPPSLRSLQIDVTRTRNPTESMQAVLGRLESLDWNCGFPDVVPVFCPNLRRLAVSLAPGLVDALANGVCAASLEALILRVAEMLEEPDVDALPRLPALAELTLEGGPPSPPKGLVSAIAACGSLRVLCLDGVLKAADVGLLSDLPLTTMAVTVATKDDVWLSHWPSTMLNLQITRGDSSVRPTPLNSTQLGELLSHCPQLETLRFGPWHVEAEALVLANERGVVVHANKARPGRNPPSSSP